MPHNTTFIYLYKLIPLRGSRHIRLRHRRIFIEDMLRQTGTGRCGSLRLRQGYGG